MEKTYLKLKKKTHTHTKCGQQTIPSAKQRSKRWMNMWSTRLQVQLTEIYSIAHFPTAHRFDWNHNQRGKHSWLYKSESNGNISHHFFWPMPMEMEFYAANHQATAAYLLIFHVDKTEKKIVTREQQYNDNSWFNQSFAICTVCDTHRLSFPIYLFVVHYAMRISYNF